MRYFPFLLFFSCSTQRLLHTQEHLQKQQALVQSFKAWEKKHEPVPLSCQALYLGGREQMVMIIQDQAVLLKELLGLSTSKDAQWEAAHKP